MRKMTSDEIRDTWLNFFKEHGHYIEPSASLIPDKDPTLLWINAGVAALKKYFDGRVTPEHRRIVNAQKCIRTNDIDNVGHTARHHTFFEMLGNFSIGDYFREEVIPWAFELLTSEKYFGLDKDKLYITYYYDDKDTYNLWVKCGIDPTHMVATKTNFWEIGEGPCGPDTEINYDRGEKYDKDGLGIKLLEDDIDNERYIELWNIVFSQFNADPKVSRSEYKPLPQKNIDTGAGLERIACILQETETNFETDLFYPYIEQIMKDSKYPYEGEYKLAYRVIADHIRSLTFALADGAIFSNDGRGYVLKRLVRRAARYANSLGLPTGYLSSLVPLVTKNMEHYYPYLQDKMEKTMKMIRSEEEKFSITLKVGEKLLKTILENNDQVSADDAFKLADTYGFPFELTKEIAEEANKTVDEKGYLALLKNAKDLARKARGERESFAKQSKDLLEFKDESKFSYREAMMLSDVIGLFKDGVKVDSIDDEGEIIFQDTSFYAESGGQVSDIGSIKNNTTECEVYHVSKAPNGQNLLHVKVLYGAVHHSDIFNQYPNYERRELIKKNHSATHLLQKALQELISPDIVQEGAYYDDELGRFDFSYQGKVENLDLVEKRVNEMIFASLPVKIEIMDKEKALHMHAMHLFDEKYGDHVRVVSMGDYSTEFCAGTHVLNTSEINLFTIVSESAISAGTRRIVFYTGKKAYEYMKEKENRLNSIATYLKVNSPKDIISKLESINNKIEGLESNIKKLSEANNNNLFSTLCEKVQSVNGKTILIERIEDIDHKELDNLVRKLIDKYPSLLLFIASGNKEKKDIVFARGRDLSIKAGQIMREISKLLGGSGGGKDDVAYGGVKSLDNFAKVKEYIENINI